MGREVGVGVGVCVCLHVNASVCVYVLMRVNKNLMKAANSVDHVGEARSKR